MNQSPAFFMKEEINMSNETDMRPLLKERESIGTILSVFEEDPIKYATELRNYRQKLKGLLAKLEE